MMMQLDKKTSKEKQSSQEEARCTKRFRNVHLLEEQRGLWVLVLRQQQALFWPGPGSRPNLQVHVCVCVCVCAVVLIWQGPERRPHLQMSCTCTHTHTQTHVCTHKISTTLRHIILNALNHK
jgi:hypothetical protein